VRHGARRKHAQGANRKKLIEAGRTWAYVEPGKDGTAEDLQYINLPVAPVDDQPDIFYLDHENLEAWQVFTACCTQWRLLPMGGIQGLDYSALQSVLAMRGVENTRITFEKVQLIEQGALAQMKDNAAFEKLEAPKTP